MKLKWLTLLVLFASVSATAQSVVPVGARVSVLVSREEFGGLAWSAVSGRFAGIRDDTVRVLVRSDSIGLARERISRVAFVVGRQRRFSHHILWGAAIGFPVGLLLTNRSGIEDCGKKTVCALNGPRFKFAVMGVGAVIGGVVAAVGRTQWMQVDAAAIR